MILVLVVAVTAYLGQHTVESRTFPSTSKGTLQLLQTTNLEPPPPISKFYHSNSTSCKVYTCQPNRDPGYYRDLQGSYWGERERAPHRRVCCGICLYYRIYLVRRAVSHFRLLFGEFLRHSLIQNLFTNGQLLKAVEGTNRRTSSMATVRTETTRGPTYSMTRAIGATPWRKGSSVDAIVWVPHGQFAYNGRVINLPQDVACFANCQLLASSAQ